MSSGSDPHLMALLRAIRLRAAAPEAFAAGEADVEAALKAQTARPMPGPEPAALPPAATRAVLPSAEPPPRNADPFAQHATPERPELPDAHPADPPRTVNPLRAEPPETVAAVVADPAASIAPDTPHQPYKPPVLPLPQVPGPTTPGPTPPGPTPPGPTPPGPTPPGPTPPGPMPAGPMPSGPAPSGPAPSPAAPSPSPAGPPLIPGADTFTPSQPPAGPPITYTPRPPGLPPANLPATTPPANLPATTPPANLPATTPPAGLPATPPPSNNPQLPNDPPPVPPPWTGRPQPAPQFPMTHPPAPQPPATTTPGPAATNPGALVPHEVPASDVDVPWTASTTRPVHQPAPQHGGYISTGPVSIDPVPGLSAVSRPVPGQYPEPVTPVAHPMPLPGVPKVGESAPTTATDGMNPADDAALREVQRLLSNSLSLAGGADEVALRLRAALMLARPELMALVPGSPQSQREQLGQALTWLVHNLDQPPALVAGCVQLGGALAECGVQPQQLTLIGAALAEAMRAGMVANGWRQDFDQAWRSTWQHVHEWITNGAEAARYQPVTWLAEVVSHELRRPDLAVVRFRPYLPMPFRPGQYARIEVPEVPGVWRPYSLAGAPRRDTVVELHVRAKTEAGVSGTLVYRTKAGDRVRFGRAQGRMGVPPGNRDLLLVAGDTGVAPLKAMLTELAATGDRRSAVLFWGVRDLDELYDIEEIATIARACHRATVVPVVSVGEAGQYASGLVTDAIAAYGEWSGADVFLAGPPIMLAATSAALQDLGVAPDRIHHDSPEG